MRTHRLSYAGLAAALAAFSTAFSQAQAADKIALVIGAYEYNGAIPDLENPAKDAADMASLLQKLGFELVGGDALDNPSIDTLRNSIKQFRDAQQQGSLALLYYAGHATEIRGENFLVPVDAKLQREDDKDFELLPLSFILNQMKNSGARTTIVILDACRNDPFAPAVRAMRVSSGLAYVPAQQSFFIAFATQPNNVALDGPPGLNSPYTRALLDNLAVPNVPIFYVFDDVSRQVSERTDWVQVPFQNYTSGMRGVVINEGIALAAAEPVALTELDTKSASLRSVSGNAAALVDDPERAIEIAKAFVRAFEPFQPEAVARLKFRAPFQIAALERGPYAVGYGRTAGVKAGDRAELATEELLLDRVMRETNLALSNALARPISTEERAALLSRFHKAEAVDSIGRDWLVRYLNDSARDAWAPQTIAEAFSAYCYVDDDKWPRGSVPLAEHGFATASLGRDCPVADVVLASSALQTTRRRPGMSLGSDQVRRRAIEALLFLTGSPTTAAEMEGLRFLMRFEEFGLTPRLNSETLLDSANEYQRRRAVALSLVSVPLDAYQEAAVVSFVFNAGSASFQRSTWRQRLNNGDVIGASEALRWWNRAAGREIKPLVLRREAEAALLLRNVPREQIAAYYADRPDVAESKD